MQEDRQGVVTLEAMLARAAAAAEGLRKIGVEPGQRVGLIADNSRDWIVADVAIQLARAVSVPRGTDTPVEELGLPARPRRGGRRPRPRRAARTGPGGRSGTGCRRWARSSPSTAEDAPGRTLDDLVALGAGRARLRRAGGGRPARRRRDDHLHVGHDGPTQGRGAHAVELRPPGRGGPRPRRDGRRGDLPVHPAAVAQLRAHGRVRRASRRAARSAYTDRRRFKDDLLKYRPTFMRLRAAPVGDRPPGRAARRVERGGAAEARHVQGGLRRGLGARAWGRDRGRGHVLRVHRPRGPPRSRRPGRARRWAGSPPA